MKVKLELETSAEAHQMLQKLVRTGLYGTSVEEAAEELLRQKLQEIQSSEWARESMNRQRTCSPEVVAQHPLDQTVICDACIHQGTKSQHIAIRGDFLCENHTGADLESRRAQALEQQELMAPFKHMRYLVDPKEGDRIEVNTCSPGIGPQTLYYHAGEWRRSSGKVVGRTAAVRNYYRSWRPIG